jgi:hypothetical protein
MRQPMLPLTTPELETPMKIYTANLDSPHYSFSGAGRTEAKAYSALINGLRKHGKERNLPAKWWKDLECDIVYVTHVVGGCTRDRELV